VRTRLALAVLLACVLAACASVLGIHPRDGAHPFEHRKHVLNRVGCLDCHAGVASNPEEPGLLHLPSDSVCLRCHQKPHDERSCSSCHGEPRIRGEAALAHDHLKFDHRKHMPSVAGNCARCHTGVEEARPESIRPKMAVCFGCHEHRDEWTLRDCDACHKDLGAEDSPPESHLVHDGDWIREHGVRAGSARDLCSSCHSERSCAKCHGVGTVPTLPSKLAFEDVPLSGLHRAGFRARHAEEATANPGMCTTCHSENSCVECHTRSHVAPGSTTLSPHPPGWVSTAAGGGDHGVQARINPMSCAGCHGGAGEQLCVGCHKVGGAGGNPHGPGFRSNKNKFHDVPCILCHGVN